MNTKSTEPERHTVTPTFSAQRIAELLASDAQSLKLPTDEQQRVIEHPLSGTALVVAGAGSGKTETIANRVVWLVANGLAQSDEVLGLTFTRKAAGELAERIQLRLERFTEQLREESELGRLTPREARRAEAFFAESEENLLLPQVSTYDAFAAAIVQEFGGIAGVSAEVTLIDSATAWGIAREVIVNSDDPTLLGTTETISSLASKVLALDQAIADNQTSAERVERVSDEFCKTLKLPYNEKQAEPPGGRGPYRDLVSAVENVQNTSLIARHAQEFATQKKQRGLAQFSDQLRLALDIVSKTPEAAAALRRRSRVVLLDEMQDTSVAQGRLLSSIFRGEAVMAVGDPHQSIYGWRGASAEGMSSFHQDFHSRGSHTDSATLSLSVSWRNARSILEAANTISGPLRATSSIDVRKLSPSQQATQGTIEWNYPETIREEREQLADWFQRRREETLEHTGMHPTGAVILRSRKYMASFAKELNARGIPTVIVGVGGLLKTPEVADVVATLRSLWFADAGSDLIRILSGPRFRLGVTDLAGLRRAARWFENRDVTHQRLEDEDLAEDSVLRHPDRRFTIIDALDEVAAMKNLDHSALQHISEEGKLRLKEAGLMFRRLRQRATNEIPALLRDIETELRLDIELEAAEHRDEALTGGARVNLDAFAVQVDNFLAVDHHGTLASLLQWLDRAETDDEVAEYVPEPTPGTVQITTVHGSKGLEWDLVAVPRLVEREFPSAPREGNGWLRKGFLPDELRGDRASRPDLNWRIAATQKELVSDIKEYKERLSEQYLEEEQRLMYVAVTRAAKSLYLSGSFWSGLKQARRPSEFLVELAEAEHLNGIPTDSEFESDPETNMGETLEWPSDPLGNRASSVLAAAQLVREHLTTQRDQKSTDEGPTQDAPQSLTRATTSEIDPVVRLLLEEREVQAARTPDQPLMERLTASTFHEFIENPRQVERNRLRPIPQRPYRKTRVGNQFHEWVEQRTTTAYGTALPLHGMEPELFTNEGYDVSAEFDDTDETELAALKTQFERSRFAGRQPIAVELEITIPFAHRRLVCKLDAVYRVEDTAGERFEIIDWKSGRPPKNHAERESRFLQLELYRHAYAQWAKVNPEQIDVSLFYVAEGVELTSEVPRSLHELEALWLQAADHISLEETL